FRAALPVPLAAIELGFDGAWHLARDDADLYERVGDGDVMWQKERLLNALLPHLPDACRHVAWLDADVILAEPDWPGRAAAALCDAPLAQLFSSVRYLGRDGAEADPAARVVPSVAAEVASGRPPGAVLAGVTDRSGGAAA